MQSEVWCLTKKIDFFKEYYFILSNKVGIENEDWRGDEQQRLMETKLRETRGRSSGACFLSHLLIAILPTDLAQCQPQHIT